MSSQFDAFIDETLDAKGYADAEPDVKDALRDDLREKVTDFIMARTVAALSDEDLTTFEQMIDAQKPEAELQQFAMDHVPDYTTFLASALVEFQDVYLGTPK